MKVTKFVATFVKLNVTIMNSRLKQFLAAENISQSQFADAIKVVRASVSHVLSGRNKPGYDFITAIMTAYPLLNIEWLMLGKGKMYKSTPEVQEIAEPAPQYSSDEEQPLLFDYNEQMQTVENVTQEQNFVPLMSKGTSESSTNGINTFNTTPQSAVKQRKATKIIVFYDDDSYQEINSIS